MAQIPTEFWQSEYKVNGSTQYKLGGKRTFSYSKTNANYN